MSDVAEVETRRIPAHDLRPGMDVVGRGTIERVYQDLLVVRVRFEDRSLDHLVLMATDDVDVVVEPYEF